MLCAGNVFTSYNYQYICHWHQHSPPSIPLLCPLTENYIILNSASPLICFHQSKCVLIIFQSQIQSAGIWSMDSEKCRQGTTRTAACGRGEKIPQFDQSHSNPCMRHVPLRGWTWHMLTVNECTHSNPRAHAHTHTCTDTCFMLHFILFFPNDPYVNSYIKYYITVHTPPPLSPALCF